MVLPPPTEAQEELSVDQVVFSLNVLIFLSVLTGVAIGFLGAGNFVFVPLLIYLIKVPTRIAIASRVFIAMMNTLFGFLGKLAAGQIILGPAVAVVAGAALGAYLWRGNGFTAIFLPAPFGASTPPWSSSSPSGS